MKSSIRTILEEASRVKAAACADEALLDGVGKAASLFCNTARSGKAIYACGNGGSTCDAMHLVEELVARFKRERPGIRAMHFMDPAVLTCWSNDYDFESAFERQARTFCQPGDLLFGFSTSGNSKNVVRALKAGRELGATTIALTGESGGTLNEVANLCLKVPSKVTERIQEVHITIVHALIEAVEAELF
jgi:D-sedoheptulose 7-phosphate isomerase